MVLFIVIGVVIVLSLGVVGFLFYLLTKESELKKEEPILTVEGSDELKKSLAGLSNDEKIAQILKVPVGAPVAGNASMSNFEMEKQLAIKETVHQKKVEELQKELQSISDTAQEQSKEALNTIEELKKENEKLRSEQNSKETAVAAKLIQAEQEVQAMREEQGGLQNRLNESQLQVGKLQEEMTVIKQKMTEEVFKYKTETELLAVENDGLKKNLDEAIAKAVQGFQQEMNVLKEENLALKAAQIQLTQTNQELTQSNAQLLEKSEGLQWELTKTRAQTTSFERSSENYQAQLQDALSRIAVLEKDLKASKTSANTQLESTSQEGS